MIKRRMDLFGREIITHDIVGCARCGGDGHNGLNFVRLVRPVEVGGEKLTHWAICPNTGEPILLLIIETTDAF